MSILRFFDVVTQRYKEISQTDGMPIQLSGRIPEYSWLDGGTAPTPTEDFAWGYKFNTTTGVVTAYGWSGTAWVEVV